MDDQADVIDVDAARGDVGGDEDRGLARGERLEVAHSRVLREVAVQVDACATLRAELAREVTGAALGAREHDRARADRGEVGDDANAIGLLDLEHVVVGGTGRGRAVVDRVRDRIGEESLDQGVDAAIEGRGEEQALGIRRRGREDALDAGQEPEVRHVVGLVEHRDLDVVEAAVLLLHEVFEAPRAGDDDVDAAVQCGDLASLWHATEDDRRAQAHRLGKRGEGLVDLAGQLAGGCEDEGARSATAGAGSGRREPRDQRDAERVGLTRAGASASEHVAARKCVRQSRRLDGGGRGDSVCGKHVEQGRGHAEIGERG